MYVRQMLQQVGTPTTATVHSWKSVMLHRPNSGIQSEDERDHYIRYLQFKTTACTGPKDQDPASPLITPAVKQGVEETKEDQDTIIQHNFRNEELLLLNELKLLHVKTCAFHTTATNLRRDYSKHQWAVAKVKARLDKVQDKMEAPSNNGSDPESDHREHYTRQSGENVKKYETRDYMDDTGLFY